MNKKEYYFKSNENYISTQLNHEKSLLYGELIVYKTNFDEVLIQWNINENDLKSYVSENDNNNHNCIDIISWFKLYQFKFNVNMINQIQVIKHPKLCIIVYTKDNIISTPIYFNHKESLDLFIISIRPFFYICSISSQKDIWINKSIENNQTRFDSIKENHLIIDELEFININNDITIEYGSNPLTYEQWINIYLDSNGRVKNKESVLSRIYSSGVNDDIRKDIWKFLLGYYSWNSSFKEREERDAYLLNEYQNLIKKWKDEEIKESFNEIIHKIDRDIYRTNVEYISFNVEDNVLLLKDLLVSYAHYNLNIGYVQGMNNLLAEIMVTMDLSPHESFWCFVFLMDSLEQRFSKDQSLMFSYFEELKELMKDIDNELLQCMKENDIDNMVFTFQWLLLDFQREFKRPHLCRVWEILWTKKPCSKFNLYIALAIIIEMREAFLECKDSSVIKMINQLPANMNPIKILKKAEELYMDTLNHSS